MDALGRSSRVGGSSGKVKWVVVRGKGRGREGNEREAEADGEANLATPYIHHCTLHISPVFPYSDIATMPLGHRLDIRFHHSRPVAAVDRLMGGGVDEDLRVKAHPCKCVRARMKGQPKVSHVPPQVY